MSQRKMVKDAIIEDMQSQKFRVRDTTDQMKI